jgi:tripartite ATP-independent transporter DctM subunit
MEPWLISVIIFSCLIMGLVLGLPIAFVLSGIGIIFMVVMKGPQGLLLVSSFLYSQGTNFILIAVPLFILMANFLEVSGIADDLYNTMYRWTIRIPGGLASGTIIICAIFAAMAGISGVATVTMGLIAIPSMLRHQYDKKMVVGSVMAGGALGILIPPSVIAILYGSITNTSVGKLFMGGLLPGILLASLFIIYITIRCLIQPKLGPPADESFSWREKLESLKAVVFPVLLIILVLATIYLGITTPTEAAGIGAFGSLICLIIYRRFTWENVKTAVLRSFTIACMAVWIVFGAHCFTAVYSMGGGSDFMLSLVSGINIPPLAMIGIMMFIYLILGMFMDPVGQVMLTMPVFFPIVDFLGFDPVWFGVLFIMNCEMDYITPPFGFNLFYMKAIVPKEITMGDIYRSVWPFVTVQAVALVIVMIFPELALWLPNKMITARF